MSHFRHPRLAEPAALPVRPATRTAVNLGRDAFIEALRHGHQLRAATNPYPPYDRRRDLWLAAALTEASDLLDIMAADRAAGRFTHLG